VLPPLTPPSCLWGKGKVAFGLLVRGLESCLFPRRQHPLPQRGGNLEEGKGKVAPQNMRQHPLHPFGVRGVRGRVWILIIRGGIWRGNLDKCISYHEDIVPHNNSNKK